MQRIPRLPLDQATFNKLEMPMISLKSMDWVNLRFDTFLDSHQLFYASAGGRLTPYTLKTPCLYLARSKKTAFMELYGDRLYAAKMKDCRLILPESELNRRVFINIKTDDLHLCNLVRKWGGVKLHFDAGTLWCSDLEYPQKFAEAIFRHPAKVDGIYYKSRHTDEICLVTWNRKKAHLQKGSASSLRTHLRTTDIRYAKLFDQEILLAGTRETFYRVMEAPNEF